MSNKWIQTRPFGKQYNCNAMGIAAVSSSADLMSKLNLIYWDHNYLNGCLNAQIIFQWLNKYQHEADQFIIGKIYFTDFNRILFYLIKKIIVWN